MLDGYILGSNIANVVLGLGSYTSDGKTLCFKYWSKIATAIVEHIKSNAKVNGSGCGVTGYTTMTTMPIIGMDYAMMADEIASSICTNSDGRSICYKYWKKITNEIVSHINSNALINSGIACASGGVTVSTGSFVSGAMSGSSLGTNIANAVFDIYDGDGASSEGKSLCRKYWIKIADEIVSHIESNGIANAGISGVISFPSEHSSGGNGTLTGTGSIT